MKKYYTVLSYMVVFLCLPVIVWIVDELDYRQIISLNMLQFIIILVAASAIIGLCSPRKWPMDWPLMILMPLSLAIAFFCIGCLDKHFFYEHGAYSIHHALTVLLELPWWLYVAVTLPALLTSFLRKYIKPPKLRT